MSLVFAGSSWFSLCTIWLGVVSVLTLGIFSEEPSLVSKLPPNLEMECFS